MDALLASYGEYSSDSDTESPPAPPPPKKQKSENPTPILLPPPLSLLDSPNSLGFLDYASTESSTRVRSFPHVEGDYAVHVFIPVNIPVGPRKEMAGFMRRLSGVVSGLHAVDVDVDVPMEALKKDEVRFEQVVLGREFHVSLGRTVPIRVHQIDSLVTMLKQKLQSQRRYWIDFSKWEVFVNDDCTRTFVSVEVITSGLAEITKQIQAVNEVYKLHNLPEFYEDPRPHISVAWELGDTRESLKKVVEDERKKFTVKGSLQKCIFTSRFSSILCKIGNKTHKICKLSDD